MRCSTACSGSCGRGRRYGCCRTICRRGTRCISRRSAGSRPACSRRSCTTCAGCCARRTGVHPSPARRSWIAGRCNRALRAATASRPVVTSGAPALRLLPGVARRGVTIPPVPLPPPPRLAAAIAHARISHQWIVPLSDQAALARGHIAARPGGARHPTGRAYTTFVGRPDPYRERGDALSPATACPSAS